MKLERVHIPSQPHKKIIAKDIDYYTLFLALEKQNEYCYIFESLSDDDRRDQHISFGINPLFTVSAKGQNLIFKGDLWVFGTDKEVETIHCENPYYTLRDFFPSNINCKTREGGLIGYISYEAINYFDKAVNLEEHRDFHQFNLGFYDHGLIFHSMTNELEYYYYFDDKSSEIMSLLNSGVGKGTGQDDYFGVKNGIESIVDIGNSVTKEEYFNMLDHAFNQIQEGNTFQVEVGFKNLYKIKGRKIKIYDNLRLINPSPYMIYVKFGNEEIIGASPEILINCIDGNVVTTPTAGTVARGSSVEEDKILTDKMLSDEKEVAEHSMLVDLHRNDIGKIVKLESVYVEQLMHIIKFSHVQHIVSKIVGIKDPKYDSFDVLAAILPGGVLTGVPKIETLKIIYENEKTPRGPYGGGVGRFSFNGDCTFALPIRTLFCSGDQCFTQTCSGIVLDSIPEREYQEIQNKVAAMKLAIMKTAENL